MTRAPSIPPGDLVARHAAMLRQARPLRYLSICSGIESASAAVEPLGWRPVAFAEINKAASSVLARHFGSNLPGEPLARNGVPNYGDFTQMEPAKLGPVDVLIAGTPCQAYSVAGRRLSLADARGNLTLAYAVFAHELVRFSGLRWSLWENVPGVLSTSDNAFGCLLAALVGGDDPILPAARPKPGRSNAFWRWRSAGVEVNDDGEEVVVEAGHVTRWPSAGMASGPLGRAAWRVLDAQYFGLAQRRRRVFVVVGFGEGSDPAAVLFERQGLRWHPPARGEAGQGVARPLAAGTRSSSGYRNDADTVENLIAHTLRGEGFDASEDGTGRGTPLVAESLAFGGNDTRGPISVSTAINAHGGPHGRQDFESETFIVTEDPLAFDCKAGGDTSFSIGPVVGALRGEGYGEGHAAIAFDTTQITHPENPSNPQPGDPCHPLAAEGHAPAIALAIAKPCNYDSFRHASAPETYTPSPLRALRLEVGEETFVEWGLGVSDSLQSAEVLRSGMHGARLRRAPCEERSFVVDGASPLAQGRGAGTVSEVRLAGRDRRPPQGWRLSERLAGQLGAYLSELSHQGASETRLLHNLWQASEGLGILQQALPALQKIRRPTEDESKSAHVSWAVRRLTPTECERLMGFVDGWTDGQADGPRYKQLGNSKPVPVVRWICERIAMAEAMAPLLEAAE